MLIESGGVLIRMAASDINIYKRDTQGVILMRLEEGSRVISLEPVDREDSAEDTAEASPDEAPAEAPAETEEP